ncbi:MAG: HAMP domain-containing methyl-accepting chemotaxis protein [Pseudomonadota bacterium]
MLRFFRTIGGKLSLSIAISIIAILISVSITTFLALKTTNVGLKVYEVGLFEVEQALSIQTEFEAFRGLVARTPAEYDSKKQAAFKKAAEEKLASIKLRLKDISSKGKINKNLEDIENGINLATSSSKQIFKYSANFAQDQANTVLSGDFAKAEKKLNNALKIFLKNAKQTAEHGSEELISLKNQIINYSLLSVITGILVTLITAGLLVRKLGLRLANLNQAMIVLSKGNTDLNIPDTTAKDEIGTMARALDIFKTNAIDVKKMQDERALQTQKAEEDRRKIMNNTANSFDAHVDGIVAKLGGVSDELKMSAELMASISQKTNERTENVTHASKQASTNIQTVAAATEQLSASTSEINRQVSQASNVSQQAVDEVSKASHHMALLASTSEKIGEVTALISDIAEQTNLLALNATIESARAGEAGKGFAVVVSEVKALANETAKATAQISGQIQEIQNVTKQTVSSMDETEKVIAELNKTSTSIATAVNEQKSAIHEIAQSIQKASSDTDSVTRNLNEVNQSAEETGATSNQVLNTADELFQQSELLNKEIEKFIAEVRTG